MRSTLRRCGAAGAASHRDRPRISRANKKYKNAMGVCPVCSCETSVVDKGRGEKSCSRCGYVLEEGILQETVQFQETASGGCIALGHFVAKQDAESDLMRSVGRRVTREQSIQRGLTLVEQFGSSLLVGPD